MDRISDERLAELVRWHEQEAPYGLLDEAWRDAGSAMRELTALRRPVVHDDICEDARRMWQIEIDEVCQPGSRPTAATLHLFHMDGLFKALDAAQREIQETEGHLADSRTEAECRTKELNRLHEEHKEVTAERDLYRDNCVFLQGQVEVHRQSSKREMHIAHQATTEADRLRTEIARLSSPPPERKDIAERQTAYREQLIIVQDALSERNRENVELRAKCERLEKESINADGDLQLRDERIERLRGALRDTIEEMDRLRREHYGRLSESANHIAWQRALNSARAALAASQHTAGSPPSPTGPVYEVPSDETFVILCDDQDEKPEFFQGPNAEAGARFRLATRSVSWHAHLFKRVATTARDSIGTSGSGDGVAESAEGKHECMQCGKKFSTLQHWSFHQDGCGEVRPDQQPCGDGVAGD